MIVFPLCMFVPSEWRWFPAGSALSGGTPISGPGQSADAAAGGSHVCEWQIGQLRTIQQIKTYRAILSRLNSGVVLIEVPVLDAGQPWPNGVRPSRTQFSDGVDFSDGSEFVSNPIEASLAADAFMPAWPAPPVAPTQAQISITTQGVVLTGGEYFSIIGPSGSKRLHLVNEIVGDGPSGNVWTVNFTPPFRENMDAGTVVDFNAPACTMKVDVGTVRDAWPTMQVPFTARPKIVFVEAGFVIPSEG